MAKEIWSVQTEEDQTNEIFRGEFEECEAYCKESNIEHGYIVELLMNDSETEVLDGLSIYEF